MACYEGNATLASLLISSGAAVNKQNKGNNTPLHQACYSGHDAVAVLLIKRGAELECRNSAGRTPLLQACFHGRPALVRLLVEAGADVHAKTTNGKTAWLLAQNKPQSCHAVRAALGCGPPRQASLSRPIAVLAALAVALAAVAFLSR